jgi:hypothetical protein
MEEIDKLLTQLLEKSKAENIDLIERIKANPAAKTALFQTVFDEGHRVAYGAAIQEHEKLAKRATDAEVALAAAKKKIEQLSEHNPDAAKLHDQYGKEIARLQEEIVTAQNAGLQRAAEMKREMALALVEAALVESGVNRDYAEVLALKPDVRNLVHVDEKSGTYRIMQPDKPDIPYGGSEKEQVRSLAENLKSKITNKLFLVSTVTGNGTGKDTAPPAPKGGSDGKPDFDKIRKDAQAQVEANRNANATERLAQRTGQRM